MSELNSSDDDGRTDGGYDAANESGYYQTSEGRTVDA
ncbi:hypothetical protein GGR27_000129 [Lewinella antarctica]|uniref:Uncharacterized protein n=1 Tax=Neolewinella antarctica TaxID=442734 RepID=A0ABX0X703_9BACT|nr:hypothetical protein [Neolewinella antarctica]